MVLINTVENDVSTNYVINWLNFYQTKWIRVNSKAKLVSEDLYFRLSNDQSSTLKIKINNNQIDISKISSVWYRRTPEYEYFDFDLKNQKEFKSVIEKTVISEAGVFYDFFVSSMKQKKCLGNPHVFNLNKINQLEIVSHLGLNVPETIITTKKSDVIDFYNEHKKIIVKPLHNVAFLQIKKHYYIPYTKVLKIGDINKLTPKFKPCLIQAYIEKEFEIRSFYLAGNFYSMAIFSQDNIQTSVDFRIYDEAKPNRVIPYKLPRFIEEKLRNFMKKYNLNTGSFDLIFSKSNQFIFLELNPVGQFGMVSFPCNYFLEKKIAEYLSQENEE